MSDPQGSADAGDGAMKREEFERQLTAFYREHNPAHCSKVPYIAERWQGREALCLQQLLRKYVLKLPGELYLDAEDAAHANWTRFINHSDSPNLVVERGAKSARFIVQRRAAPGDELTFSYSRGYARWIERYCQ